MTSVNAPWPDDELKQRVQTLIDKWLPILGIQNWNLELVIDDEAGAMYISRANHYRKATFSIHNKAPLDIEFTESVMERNVLHELVHLLLDSIHSFMAAEFERDGLIWRRFINAQETATDEVTSVILRLSK